MVAQQVGSLFLELTLDPSKYYEQLKQAQQTAAITGKKIEQLIKSKSIKVPVDESSLFRLNKHLDLKSKHLKQIAQIFHTSFYTNNPHIQL